MPPEVIVMSVIYPANNKAIMTVIYCTLWIDVNVIDIYLATCPKELPKVHAFIGNLVVSDLFCPWLPC